jgi:hypothetical protein
MQIKKIHNLNNVKPEASVIWDDFIPGPGTGLFPFWIPDLVLNKKGWAKL